MESTRSIDISKQWPSIQAFAILRKRFLSSPSELEMNTRTWRRFSLVSLPTQPTWKLHKQPALSLILFTMHTSRPTLPVPSKGSKTHGTTFSKQGWVCQAEGLDTLQHPQDPCDATLCSYDLLTWHSGWVQHRSIQTTSHQLCQTCVHCLQLKGLYHADKDLACAVWSHQYIFRVPLMVNTRVQHQDWSSWQGADPWQQQSWWWWTTRSLYHWPVWWGIMFHCC